MVNLIFWLVIGVAVFIMLKYSSIRYERFWTYILLVLMVFFIFTFFSVTSYNNLELKSFDDFVSGIKLYGNWLFGWVRNMATITGNAVNVDWSGNFSNSTR